MTQATDIPEIGGPRLVWDFSEPPPWTTEPGDSRQFRVGLSLMAHVEVPHDRRVEGAETCISVPVGKLGTVLVPAQLIGARLPFLLDGFLADSVHVAAAQGISEAMSVAQMVEERRLTLEPFHKHSWMGGPPDDVMEAKAFIEIPDKPNGS